MPLRKSTAAQLLHRPPNYACPAKFAQLPALAQKVYPDRPLRALLRRVPGGTTHSGEAEGEVTPGGSLHHRRSLGRAARRDQLQSLAALRGCPYAASLSHEEGYRSAI
eukprot:3116564-Prymnesium_polylepis.1